MYSQVKKSLRDILGRSLRKIFCYENYNLMFSVIFKKAYCRVSILKIKTKF